MQARRFGKVFIFIFFMIYFNILGSIGLVHWVEPITRLRHGVYSLPKNVNSSHRHLFRKWWTYQKFIVCIEIIPSRWFDNNGRFRSVRVEFGRFHGFFFPTNWLKYRCHNVYSLQHGRVALCMYTICTFFSWTNSENSP